MSAHVQDSPTPPWNSKHDLFGDTRRRLRGLSSRWSILRRSRSIDLGELQLKTQHAEGEYANLSKQQSETHRHQWSEAITDWDTLLDQQLANAERGTLENLVKEKATLSRLQTEFKSNRAQEIANFEKRQTELQQRMETAKKHAAKVRDQSRGKIDRERAGLDDWMHHIREWIGVKTGNTTLIHWTAHDTPVSAGEIAEIQSLETIASRFEERKKQLKTDMDRMQAHPALRLLNYPLLIVLGLIAGGIAGWISMTMKSPPLIIAAIAFSAAILIPALVALSSTPLLNRTLRRLFPPIVDQDKEAQLILQQGRALIEQLYQSEVQKLEKQWKEELSALESKHQSQLQLLADEFNRSKREATERASKERVVYATSRREAMQSIDLSEESRLRELKKAQAKAVEERRRNHESVLSELRRCFDLSQARAVSRWTGGVGRLAQRVDEVRTTLARVYPEWASSPMREGSWERSVTNLAWPIGAVHPELEIPKDHPDAAGLAAMHAELASLGPVPVLYDLLHHGSLVLDADAESQNEAFQTVRQVLLRAVTSLPAGSLNTTIIDPEGLGKRFSWIMHLADIDPQLVNHRVWTQPVHIADQLELAARHVEDVIQQSLRNQYRTLSEYNEQAGPMAIPYRMIVWAGFPLGLDEHSWQSLCSILASGGRCGVGVILQLADNCKWPPYADPKKLDEFGLHVQYRKAGKEIRVLVPELQDFALHASEAPDDAEVRAIMEHQLVAATNIGKRVVPFDSIAPTKAEFQHSESADGLEIPIGISDSGRLQLLKLGTGTSQHVLIAGKTGSGKSSLLHTMITSAALRYSPEELRMVLLDFKKGVEFQVYAQEELPHADIIGIESRREFGLSTLEYLDRILSARGEAFRAWGVQDLPSLKRKHPEIRLPRILIMIDEFQELFVEDDKLSQQASLLVDRLVRQGRSFGMHLILASQTLGGSYSLPRTTLSQMAVRIALQCDSSDAMLILSEDNTAAERLRHSGQGIYNEAGGRIEGNQNFQVSYIEKPAQVTLLSTLKPSVPPLQPTINPLGRRIVFEGHKPSKWDRAAVGAAWMHLSESDQHNVPWVLGDSISIEPPIIRPMAVAAGRNAMIVGSEETNLASLLAGWIRGWCDFGPPKDTGVGPTFWILDGSKAEDEQLAKTVRWARDKTEQVRVGTPRDVESMLTEIQSELERRTQAPEERFPPMVLWVLNLSRFRELRKGDEFSFSVDDAAGPKPDAIFSKLLADGPSLGMHVCVCADTTATLTRWISRSALRDIELRILMQMSSADSNQLIDSGLANRLDRYVLLAHDDADGKSVKFRPYEVDSILGRTE